jgi:GTP-binding protein
MDHHEARRGRLSGARKPPAAGGATARDVEAMEPTAALGAAAIEPTAALGAAEIEKGRLLFAQPCQFVAGAVEAAALPPGRLPEVAFAGRSNVGKSSLLNALTGQKALARVSRTPGRTRQINHFRLGDRLELVDLPGYGYARAPKGMVANWTQEVRAYFRGRPNLRRVCLLLDARHGANPADIKVMDLLDEAAVVYQVILTKLDALPKGTEAAAIAAVERLLAKRRAAHPRVIATSARAGQGIAELRAELAMLAGGG